MTDVRHISIKSRKDEEKERPNIASVSVKYKKKFKRTTDSKHNLPVAKNILNRQFDVKRPNSVWWSDISYLWTNEGWLYLAIVIDLFSRNVSGSPKENGKSKTDNTSGST